MKGNVVSVSLWGKEVCRMVWKGGYKERFGKVGSEVTFNPDFCDNGWDLDPLGYYSISKLFVQKGFSDYFRASEYEGLPRFMCGSLPDSWGNKVFAAWMQKNNIKNSEINSVDKLSFIGKRGMGALEFIPQAYSPLEDSEVELGELYNLAKEISLSREIATVDLSSNPDINDLMSVGMSAGGQHPKAIIAIDWDRKEVRSGQFLQPENFKQYLLKFKEPQAQLSAEVELAYHMMASDCGIEMMPSRLFCVKGINHFLTERFDRVGNQKIHVASLLAINGETERYEDLFKTARLLHLTKTELVQLYRRTVFNYIAMVCDDHDRNFSFLMGPDGKWKLSPAYDITFSVDLTNPLIGVRHAMEIKGSNVYEGRDQLARFAKENDIGLAKEIIDQVEDVVSRWSEYADRCGVEKGTAQMIARFLK